MQDILEDGLGLKTTFDKNIKALRSSSKLLVQDFFQAPLTLNSKFVPGYKYLEGFFVQTGTSFFGLVTDLLIEAGCCGANSFH